LTRSVAFLTVASNRVVCADHDLGGTEGQLLTRVRLDEATSAPY
jgi:hypothetical protein